MKIFSYLKYFLSFADTKTTFNYKFEWIFVHHSKYVLFVYILSIFCAFDTILPSFIDFCVHIFYFFLHFLERTYILNIFLYFLNFSDIFHAIPSISVAFHAYFSLFPKHYSTLLAHFLNIHVYKSMYIHKNNQFFMYMCVWYACLFQTVLQHFSQFFHIFPITAW